MAGAKISIEIKAPLQKVYDVITDFESYPDFLPETQEVVVEFVDKKSTQVTFTISLVKKITYTLDIKLDPPNGLSWQLVKGQMMKSNRGGWKLTAKGPKVTLAEYEIEVGLGLLVPQAIADKLIGTSLPTMMAAFKKRIEEMK